jgi:phospholipid/cholesterol/gamma-HCH transport system substrate-binding protein
MTRDPGTRSRITPAAYKMAVFTTITVLLIGVLATLVGNISLVSTNSYTALFSNATGVYPGDRVRISGVEVGSVQSVELVKEGGRHLARLHFRVEKTIPVYADATISLRYENVVGQRYVLIDERPGARAQAPAGHAFPLKQTAPALDLTVLFNGFQPLFRALSPADTNKLSYELVRALQGDSGTIGSLVQHTARLTDALADKDVVIGRVIDNLDAVLGTVDQRDTQLTDLIIQFRNLMNGLSKDRDVIGTSLPTLADLLTSAHGYLLDVRAPLRRNVKALNILAGGLADSRDSLEATLQGLPKRLRAADRAGSYGSLFNFYVCGLAVSLQLPGGSTVLNGPGLQADEKNTVCGGGEE